jgi:hypothetical protein
VFWGCQSGILGVEFGCLIWNGGVSVHGVYTGGQGCSLGV